LILLCASIVDVSQPTFSRISPQGPAADPGALYFQALLQFICMLFSICLHAVMLIPTFNNAPVSEHGVQADARCAAQHISKIPAAA
jgi:hypothetical protein